LKIRLRVETHKGIKDFGLNSWILESLKGFFFLLRLEPVMTTRCFVGRIRYSFENWVKKNVIRGESKSERKESLFPKEATHKGWQNPLIQPRVLESLKN